MNGPVDQMRELAVPGSFVRPLAVHEDRRGSFAKGFSAEQLAPLGLDIDVAELFWSWSHRGVIRGMHAQLPPRGAARVVICLSGRILDVVHDLRPGNEPKTDSVVLDGVVYGVDEPLPGPEVHRIPDTYARGYAWQEMEQAPRRLRLYRSIAMTVVDGGLPFTLRTTAETVGEALRDAKITLYLGDRVQPSLGSPVSTGLRVTIDRSTPVSVELGGDVLKTRTRGRTVADVLADLNVSLAGMDRVAPAPETPLYPDVAIKITQVEQEVEVEEQIAPFETIFEPDFGLPIDTQTVVAPGAQGITRSRTRVTYEDGVEVARVEEDNWVAQEPAQRVIAYGTRIEPQTLTTASGEQITYWRKIRMYASSYSAGTAGVSPDQPWYGRTYTGEPMRFGVVAVDPNIIPLRSQIYVPDYGYGDALDIGGAIRARRIDLGYDDDNLQYWNRWVDVYLLWPPPPEYEITWVVPNWPRVPQ